MGKSQAKINRLAELVALHVRISYGAALVEKVAQAVVTQCGVEKTET